MLTFLAFQHLLGFVTMNSLQIISDNFLSTDSVGENGMLGGAEHEMKAMLDYLNINYSCQKSTEVFEIDPNSNYIIGNFWLLHPNIKQQLINYQNYIIIEYDYKFCPNRIPDPFPNNIVPKDQIINLAFYQASKKIFCISHMQEKIFNLNGITNTEVFGTSFWTKEDFDTLNKIRDTSTKREHICAAIYGYKCDSKGTSESLSYCLQNNVDAYLLTPTDKETFWKRMTTCHSLVLFSKITESFSRVCVEANMLGLDVLTNNKIPAVKEPWFAKYKGRDCVSFLQNEQIPSALEKITKFI